MEETFQQFLLEKLLRGFLSPDECKQTLGGANNLPNFTNCLLADDTKDGKKSFESLLCHLEQNFLKHWSDSQDEFLVLNCLENNDFNEVNCLFVLSASAFKKGNATRLEDIQTAAVRYQHYSNVGFLMNTLGVMLSENVLYKKSEECFAIAKRCFEREQDHLRDAVVTFNQAVLHKALGNDQKVHDLCDAVAFLCHDISMRTPNDSHLPEKLLKRVAVMSQEIGNFKIFHKIVMIGEHFDISSANKATTVHLTQRLMKLQLKEEVGEIIQAQEVEDCISDLCALLDKPEGVLLNADFTKTVMIAAKIYRNTGHLEEACNLLEKLQNTFLLVHGGKSPVYGSLLYQVGCFLHGSGKFGEAEISLKKAEEILISYFGTRHHSVALCKGLLGSCVLLKGDTEDALKHLTEAQAMFKNINHWHPQAGEILLKLSLLYIGKGHVQIALETMEEAMDIFISACGEVSCKTAGAYFQLGLILQKVDELRALAVEKIKKAIEILLNLGLNLNHPDVKICSSVLGALQHSLGMTVEAEKCFIDVQRNASLVEEPCSMKAKITTPEVTNLHFQVKSDRGRCSYFEAVVISLVNLVHMKTGIERCKHLNTLVSCLEENETEKLQIWDFAGQNVYCVSHRVPVSDQRAFFILFDSVSDSAQSDESDSDMFLSSSKKSPFVLFWRIPQRLQEMKEFKCLDSAFRESVHTLFLQPKFRRGYSEAKDFYKELTVPTIPHDMSSLCSQIDRLPLLVELELSELHSEWADFDYLTSWESSVKSAKPSVHVSYFSYKCSNQRETEFVFDHLIHSLGQNLALNKVQGIVISNTSSVQNVASFLFQEPSNSSLSIIAENESVAVKCRTVKELDSNCVCSSVRNALENSMQSLCEIVRLNIEPSVWLPCEDVGAGVKESSSRNFNLDVKRDPSSSGLLFRTGDFCASSSDPESEIVRKPTVGVLLNDDDEDVSPVCHPSDNNFMHSDVDVCLCLLDCLLSQVGPASPEQEALRDGVVSSTDSASYTDNIQVNQSPSISSSLNSLPVSPSTFSESGDCLFVTKKSSSEGLSSVGKLKGYDLCLLADQSNSKTSTCRNSKLSENLLTDSDKCNELCVEFPENPHQFSNEFHLSSFEEGLSAGGSPDSETQQTNQLDLHRLQTFTTDVSEEERLSFADNHKHGEQDIHASDTESSKLLSTKCLGDLHGNLNCKRHLSVELPGNIPFSTVSSEKIDVGTLTDDCLRPLGTDLEGELAVSQKQHYELQQRISQVEEQLKQSEEEKQKLQADLGRYQFLEEKERRRERVLSETNQGRCQLIEEKERCCERLLGGTPPLHEPVLSGFTLHARLLEISNSLSAEEVKQIKFLAKSKVDGFRRARITEAFELFEVLETRGEFPCDYIGKLLAGIQRFDLVEKLGIPLPGAEKGSNYPPGQSLSDRKYELPDHVENSPESMPSQNNRMDAMLDRHDRERRTRHKSSLASSQTSVRLQGSEDSRTEEMDCDRNLHSSISSSRSSDESGNDMPVMSMNAEGSDGSSMQSAFIAVECPKLPNSSDDGFLSNFGCSISAQTTQTTYSNHTSQGSNDSSDGLPVLKPVNSHSAFTNAEISSDSGLNPISSEDETQRNPQLLTNSDENEDVEVAGACTAKNEEREERPLDFCDGMARPVPSARTRASDVGNMQGVFPDAEMSVDGRASGATDWERLGARPKQAQLQQTVVRQMLQEPLGPVTDGLTGDFLARHSQDKALHDSLYQSVSAETLLFNDTPPLDTSYIDGAINVSESSKAELYFGDCQAAPGADPYSRVENPLLRASNEGFERSGRDGGFSYNDHVNGDTGLIPAPLPSHLEGNNFSFYGNYSSRNASNATNSYSLQSGFELNDSRFAGLYSAQRHTAFIDQHGAQRFTAENPPEQGTRQTPQNANLALEDPSSSTVNNNRAPLSASARNIPPGDVQYCGLPAPNSVSSSDPTRATGLDSTTTSWPALVRASSNTMTVGDEMLACGTAGGTCNTEANLEPSRSDVVLPADNCRASVLNNTDFGTDSIESTDNSLVALEQRVAEACALVERVLREREEREQFGREIERKEQLIREQRARERLEREEREIQEAERWPQEQEAITARTQWLCEHYQRHCRVRFPCCTQFYPCHRCHNISRACDNEEAKASHAIELKCSHCQHEQEIGEDSKQCRKCGGDMSAYFCSICKHFTSVDKNPYHCEMCGICRIHQDKSFHCKVCNVCLDKRLEGNHKCRADSGHDECCICLEDAFSGCQILPCSHKVHRECAIAMIQNGIRTCPICRHPLYSPPRQ